MRFLCFSLFLIATLTTAPSPSNAGKGRRVSNLDKDYGINVAGSPVYEHYRKARTQTDYLDIEMAKLGTGQVPKFKPIKASQQTNV
jgi:hypothetical protein